MAAPPLTSQTRLAFLFFLLFMIIILRWKENKKEKMQTMTERRTDRTGGGELKNFGLKRIFLSKNISHSIISNVFAILVYSLLRGRAKVSIYQKRGRKVSLLTRSTSTCVSSILSSPYSWIWKKIDDCSRLN